MPASTAVQYSARVKSPAHAYFSISPNSDILLCLFKTKQLYGAELPYAELTSCSIAGGSDGLMLRQGRRNEQVGQMQRQMGIRQDHYAS